MKKFMLLFGLLGILLLITSKLFAGDELGLTVKYDPFAGIFERTLTSWSYTQESILLGAYANLNIDPATTLTIQAGIIPGSDEIGREISIVGASTKLSLSLDKLIIVNYGCSYYFPGQTASPIYDMCTGVAHSANIQVFVPLFGRKISPK